MFYWLGGNSVIDKQVHEQLLVPQRDVLHIRLNATKRRYPFPLVGDTPLGSALQDIATSNAMTKQQIQFYLNQARPSAVLTTDLILDKDQVQFIRDRWDEQSKGLKQGGTPILTGGLKPMMLSSNSKDSDLAEVMKLTEQRIALAFRVPLAILGIGGTAYSSTELLMQSWIASGLGFALNHIEDAFGRLFSLKGQPDEYVEFDTKALLRSAFKDRIAGLTQAVQGGILAPNEARAEESYGGSEIRRRASCPATGRAPVGRRWHSFGTGHAPGAPPQPGAAKPALPPPDKPPPEEKPISAKDYSDVVASHLRSINAYSNKHYASSGS